MRLLIAPVVLFVVLASLGARADSLTRDEGPFLDYGLRQLAGETTRRQVFNSKLPVTALHALPVHLSGGAAVTSAGMHSVIAPWALDRGRAVSVALGAALVLAVGLGGHALAGARAGQAAALLAALEPNLLAHGHLVTADGGAALATLLLALATARVARTGRARDAALAGAAFGATLLCKFMLFVWAPLAAVAVVALRGPGSWRRVGAGCGAFLLAAVLVIDAGHALRGVPGRFPDRPRSRKVGLLETAIGRPPLPLPEEFLAGLDWTASDEEQGRGFGNLYHLGEVRTERRGWWHYYLATGALKLPLGFLALALLGVATRSRERLVLRALLVGWLLFLSVGNRAQIGFRHALPVVPLLAIEAGAAFAALERAGGWRRNVARGLVAWVAASVALAAPDFVPYVNELVRGPAYRRVGDSNLDWGQADRTALAWAREEVAAGRPVAVEPAGPVTGRVLVRASALVGITVPPERYAWLRAHEPVKEIRGAWLVFDVPP